MTFVDGWCRDKLNFSITIHQTPPAADLLILEHGAEWSDYCVADKPEVVAEEQTVFTGVGHQAVLVCEVRRKNI